jgi:hypothetical protein
MPSPSQSPVSSRSHTSSIWDSIATTRDMTPTPDMSARRRITEAQRCAQAWSEDELLSSSLQQETPRFGASGLALLPVDMVRVPVTCARLYECVADMISLLTSFGSVPRCILVGKTGPRAVHCASGGGSKAARAIRCTCRGRAATRRHETAACSSSLRMRLHQLSHEDGCARGKCRR